MKRGFASDNNSGVHPVIFKAMEDAKPIILEPIQDVKIMIPDEYMGDILADINRRRGKIETLRRFRKGSQKLNGTVPLKEMFGYASTLRTLSSGRASFSMEFLNYAKLPESLEEEIIKERNEKEKEKADKSKKKDAKKEEKKKDDDDEVQEAEVVE